jgi:hypothetical protein
MIRHFIYSFIASLILFSCKSKEAKPAFVMPDMQDYFSKRLHAADSTIQIDSFRLIRLDTLHEKWALTHQRYPYLHDFGKISAQLDSIQKQSKPNAAKTNDETRKTIQYLEEEKTYLKKEIDSINNLLAHADTANPIGYMVRYKSSFKKKDGTLITDTINFSFDAKLKMLEWDRNIEKAIDSLVAGKHVN